jgi:riboflavin synthase alpha subunit
MMFRGLIEDVGNVVALRPNESTRRPETFAPRLAGRVHLGGSVAINGCCLIATANQKADPA